MIKPLFFHLLANDHFQDDFLNKLCMGSFKKYVVFDLPPPLFVPVRFACTHVLSPPSTYVRFSELPSTPSQKMFRDAYDVYFEKNIGGDEKWEKN